MLKISTTARLELDNAMARRLAALFTLFLFGFESVLLRPGYTEYVYGLFVSEGSLRAGVAVILTGASVLLAYLFFHSAFRASWRLRPFYVLTAFLSFTAEYSYQKALGRFSEVLDVELAFATTYEQKYASLLMYLGYAAVIPSIVFLVLLIFTKGGGTRGLRNLLAVNILLVSTVAAMTALSAPRIRTISTFAFYRTAVEFTLFGPITHGEWGSEVTGISEQRLPVKAPALAEGYQPDNNVVLIVDESVRGDHFSLNGYERKTTPFLDDLESRGVLKNWGIAAAASTGSHTSYNIIVTGLTPDDLPDFGTKLRSTPTIFQYAKAMGYKTWFFDGQMDYFWGGIKDDQRSIDHWFGVDTIRSESGVEDWNIDIAIAGRVKNIVSGSKGNFIFVFKHGSHVPYHRNFPSEHAVWQPSYISTKQFDIPGPDMLGQVVNAYDNSILYNVNSFFAGLIDDYDQIPNNTAILYTGDHGQTLFANGKASHSGQTREEATVPLLMIGGPREGIDTSYKASHHNLYPTILDLINYPAELREREFSLSLLKATGRDSRPRFYNPSYGAKMPFDH